jgi:hypothetical protein
MIPTEGSPESPSKSDVPDSIAAAASPEPAILASLIDDVCEAGVSREEARRTVATEWQSVVAQGSQGQFLAAIEACTPEKRKWLGRELAAVAKKQTQQLEVGDSVSYELIFDEVRQKYKADGLSRR